MTTTTATSANTPVTLRQSRDGNEPGEMSGVVVGLRWPKADSDFVIAEVRREDSRIVSCIGNCPKPESFDVDAKAEPDSKWILTPQCSYRFFGSESTHPKYGYQFRFQTFIPARPFDRPGVTRYLQTNCKGIGQATATALWNLFKSDAVRLLRESPEVVVAALNQKRFTMAMAEQASKALWELERLEGTTIELLSLLDGRGFPKRVVRECIMRWGPRAVDWIQANPYRMMAFKGCGFLKCDAMYLDVGLPPDKMKRQVLCAWHACAKDSEGHVWLPEQDVHKHLQAKIAGVSINFDKALSVGQRHKIITTRRDCFACEGRGFTLVPDLWDGELLEARPCDKCGGTGGRLWVAEGRRAAHEQAVADKVVEMRSWPVAWPQVDDETLSDHQREQLQVATSAAFGALCGSPGTGKTFSIARLARTIVSLHGEGSLCCVCPTGKAAVRMTEAMRQHGLNIVARTIHSTLGVEQADDTAGGGWQFRHGPGNPLPFRFVICDEFSMVGNSLLNSLLKATAKGTNILAVGDPNQLPPVEAGAPLRDLTASGEPILPTGMLTQIHRNAGAIVRACHAIKDGKPFETCNVMEPDAEPPENLMLVAAGKESGPKKILRLIQQLKDEGIDVVWDCQVIVAVNKRSPLSREKLNTELQGMLNPQGEGDVKSPFRVGDKIICLKNSFFDFVKLDGRGTKTLVCNGEIGRCLAAEERRTIVKFFNPDREVSIPRSSAKPRKNGNGGGEGDGGDNGGDGNGGGESEDTGTGCDLSLAYAVTCHKLQGSSAPIVIVALDPYPGATGPLGICQREWLYTALSRAERRCYMVGLRSTADEMCSRQAIWRRKTFLSELIRNAR